MTNEATWVEVVLVPALVAAAVTLLFNVLSEFLLKPYANARSDRVLRGRRVLPDFLMARDALDARLWPLFRLGQPWDATRTALEVAEATAAADRALEALATARGLMKIEIAAATRPMLLDLKALLVELGTAFKDGTWRERTDEREALTQYADYILRMTRYYDLPRWQVRKRKEAFEYAADRMAP